MKVILVEDVTALEEVEIVAYGTQKKVTMTGAIASVKGEELTRVSVGSVSNVLGGQMTGLTTVQYSGEPGADAAEIFIRGKATWENSSPLIQVDGVDRESMSDIDPNEIESISILKDASATAVFGIRGANGVILITTKRGKEGKAKISFTTSASVHTQSDSIHAQFFHELCIFTHFSILIVKLDTASFHHGGAADICAQPIFTSFCLPPKLRHSIHEILIHIFIVMYPFGKYRKV